MIRRLIRVILARKRDAAGWRAEARRWERLYYQERQRGADLLDKALVAHGLSPIQEQPDSPSEPREVRIEDMTDQEFEARMEAEEVAMWAARATTDLAARTYLEGLASNNATAARALQNLKRTNE